MSHIARKFLKFAIIGPPNGGKSLLTNQLVKAEVAAVSKRMDTTRCNLTAAYTEDNCQLVAVDSPGLVGIQHATSKSVGKELTILTDPEKAMKNAEHVLVVQDATHTGDYIHHRVLYLLNRYNHIPASLVINKVDLIEDRSQLLPLVKILTDNQVDGKKINTKRVTFGKLGKIADDKIISETRDGIPLYQKNKFSMNEMDEKWKTSYRIVMNKPYDKCSWAETKKLFTQFRGWPYFKSVFFVSSLTGEGIGNLRDYLVNQATPGKWMYEENTLTTKNPKDIVLDQIKAECLNHLPSEAGYGIKLRLMDWSFNDERLNIIVELICDKKRWAKLLIQNNPSRIAYMEDSVNNIIQNLINQPLFIKLLVKYNGQTVTEDNYQKL
uniref:G domain-containing protein n=1 Tax=Parastrongyloides trichosuri TaxID=131310 RepID=A0A0N4ZSL7_PARTI